MRPDDVTRNNFSIWWESHIVPTSILLGENPQMVGFSKNTTRPTDIQTDLQKCEKSKVGDNCGVAKLDTFFHFQLCACLTKFLARLHPVVIEGGRTERKCKQTCSNIIIPIIFICFAYIALREEARCTA